MSFEIPNVNEGFDAFEEIKVPQEPLEFLKDLLEVLSERSDHEIEEGNMMTMDKSEDKMMKDKCVECREAHDAELNSKNEMDDYEEEEYYEEDEEYDYGDDAEKPQYLISNKREHVYTEETAETEMEFEMNNTAKAPQIVNQIEIEATKKQKRPNRKRRNKQKKEHLFEHDPETYPDYDQQASNQTTKSNMKGDKVNEFSADMYG